jgi:hypothetical protein
MNVYSPGQSVRFSVSVTYLGTLTSPPSVLLTVHGPDGTTLTPTVVNDSTGVYHADTVIPITSSPGLWAARWLAPGITPATAGLVDTQFSVQALLF